MQRETLAEVLCNLAGQDPNDDEVWAAALVEADDNLDAAARGKLDAWWEE